MSNGCTRVLIVGFPAMLCELLTSAMSNDPEIELQIIEDMSELAIAMDRFHPQVLISSRFDTDLLYRLPHSRAYLLGEDARTVCRTQLRPVSEEMGELSLADFVRAIKAQSAH